jgi:hypothetical protein
MDLQGSRAIDDALDRVGQLLAARGSHHAIVVLGGAAMNLLGIISRSTTDVDILAFADVPRIIEPGGERALPGGIHPPPEPLSVSLVDAARTVARDMDLADDWLNTGPALQWRAGLPPGLELRIHWRRYSALWVGLVDRYDLIFFKLFAAADSVGPRSVHYRDLAAMRPSATELEAAAEWVRTQDASTAFADGLEQVLRYAHQDLDLQ